MISAAVETHGERFNQQVSEAPSLPAITSTSKVLQPD
jgi:starch synthase